MKKMLIMQHYSPNKGNVSLLYSLVENIKKTIPNASVEISSFNPKDTKNMFGYEVFDWPFCVRKIANTKGLDRIFNGIYELIFATALIMISFFVRIHLMKMKNLKDRFSVIKKIKNADLLILPGGHLFTNFNGFVGVFAHFLPCLLSVILSKKYLIIGQTIGPFFGVFKIPTIIMTRFVIKHAEYVSVRDSNSLHTLKKTGINIKNVHKTNEIVYLFPKVDLEKFSVAMPVQDGRSTLGITIHHIYYKKWFTRKEYVIRIAQFIDLVKKNFDLNILFIPMEKRRKGESERFIIGEIISRSKDQKNISLAQLSMDPRITLSLLNGIDYLCATKTHSVIYGLLMGLPTLAVAYAQKTRDFMKDFALEDYCIDLKDFTPEEGHNIFSKLVKNKKDIIKSIHSNFVEIKKQSEENILAIRKILGAAN